MLLGRSRVLEEVEFAVFGAAEEIRNAVPVEVDGGGTDVMAFDILLHERSLVLEQPAAILEADLMQEIGAR
jgi:hypothetical protein